MFKVSSSAKADHRRHRCSIHIQRLLRSGGIFTFDQEATLGAAHMTIGFLPEGRQVRQFPDQAPLFLLESVT